LPFIPLPAPASPTTSPPASPTTSTQRDHVASLLGPKRRNTNTSSPINIFGASSRFQRMKLEQPAPGSPIVGSSPKRSWFSNFFSKADKEEKDKTVKEQTFGIYSKKSFLEIVAELQKVLTQLGINWEFLTNQTFKAKFDTSVSENNTTTTVKFTIELLNIGKDNTILINFIHKSGPYEAYNEMCEKLHDELDT